MTWGGIPPSGYFATFNIGGGAASFDYEPASGDVSGLIDNLIVVGIQGRAVSPLSPNIGDIYKWDGTQWVPVQDASGVSQHNLLSSVHIDTIPANPLEGSIIAGSGSPASWVIFPIGLPHQNLRVNKFNKLEWQYEPIDIVTSGTNIELTQDSHRVVINKSVGSDTQVVLPSGTCLGHEILIKDGKGDANQNKITIIASGGLTIDGQNSIIIRQKYQSMHFMYNGTEWNII